MATDAAVPVIRTQRLGKIYSAGTEAEVVALRGVDLIIERGGFVAIMGPSGSGKSTLMNLLGCLDKPTSGSYECDGVDVSTLDAEQLAQLRREKIGFVFQGFHLLPRMDATDNVAMPLGYAQIAHHERRTRALAALEAVGLGGRADHFPNELSGGQQQRVALARALVIRPSVLLLDESLSNLDAKLRDAMRHEIREIQRSLQITTLFVTHDQVEALTMCDRIAVMNRGCISQIGTPTEIYEKPATRFVASFVGKANVLPATRDGDGRTIVWGASIAASPAFADRQFDIFVRPQRMRLAPTGESVAADMARVVGRVAHSVFVGDHIEVIIEGRSGERLAVDLSSGDAPPPDGADIAVVWREKDTLLFQREAA